MGFASRQVCFWSGKAIGIAISGKVGQNLPDEVMLDYEPHEDVAAEWALGVAIFEVSEKPYTENQPPIQKVPVPLYPSGRYMVVKPELIDRMISDPENCGNIKKVGKLYIDGDLFGQLLKQIQPAQ